MDFSEWLKNNDTIKSYAHFDNRVKIGDVISKIQDKENIIHHSFMPFIHYTQKFKKFSKKHNQILRKDKDRELYYSAHYDRCIYQYYAFLLNEKYNEFLRAKNLENTAIAYRNNLHKSNIEFSKEAFDFIKKHKQCYIIVSDFKNFFDKLNHSYLKVKLCQVLGCSKLPDDWYAVFKNITKFSWVNLEDILELFGMENNLKNKRLINKKRILVPIAELRKSKELINKNKNNYGIPQGSAISAILSNVYMIEFDKKLKEYIERLGGKYLRYSDDSIFIIPNINEEECIKVYNTILTEVSSVPDLDMQKEKTKIYEYNETEIVNKNTIIGIESSCDKLDYLGFTFDGKNICLRDKTITKYYYRTYHKVDSLKKSKSKQKTRNELYEIYTLKGCEKRLNFLTYAKRCRKVYGKKEKVNSIFNKHMSKIKSRIED